MNGFSLNNQANDYDVIIIGGGPAGTTAAIYTARSELRTLVIDKGLTAGALGVTSKISNYPGVPGPISGAKLVEIMREQAESFGATFITDKVVGLMVDGEQKEIIAGTGNYRAKVVILATGAMGRTSTVKGEEALLGRGVSYCATCDGAFFRDQDVAVIGNKIREELFGNTPAIGQLVRVGDRRLRVIEPIRIYGHRAVVECVVSTGGRDFHNLRLFVRRDDGWKLLGWANEPV